MKRSSLHPVVIEGRRRVGASDCRCRAVPRCAEVQPAWSARYRPGGSGQSPGPCRRGRAQRQGWLGRRQGDAATALALRRPRRRPRPNPVLDRSNEGGDDPRRSAARAWASAGSADLRPLLLGARPGLGIGHHGLVLERPKWPQLQPTARRIGVLRRQSRSPRPRSRHSRMSKPTIRSLDSCRRAIDHHDCAQGRRTVVESSTSRSRSPITACQLRRRCSPRLDVEGALAGLVWSCFGVGRDEHHVLHPELP